MGRKRRLRLRRSGSGRAGGSGRASGAGQNETGRISGGAGPAGRLGLKGEPDRGMAKGLRDFMNRLREDTMRPDFDRDVYVRGMLEQGAPKELVDLVDGMVSLSANKMSATFATMKAMKEGNLKEAKRLIEEAERLHGYDASVARYHVLNYEGKLEKALALCESNIAGSKEDMLWIDAKADILSQMGRAEERLELYESAHKSVRGTPDWLAGRARALVAVGRLDEAEKIATGILESGEYPDTACVALGEALMARGDHRGAISLFNQVLDIDMNDDRGYIGKAEALAAMGRHREAVEVCDMRLNVSKASGQLKRVRDRVLAVMDDE